ncbi:hypothetical protein M569_09191, partial [Genlisea aurea]
SVMGCTVREKHIRTNRRTRLGKSESDHSPNVKTYEVEKLASSRLGVRSNFYENALNVTNGNPSSVQKQSGNSSFDYGGWGCCSEEQLEELLLKNLELLYNETINRLLGLGYSEDLALKAVLSSGVCYGGVDVLTDILLSCLSYLTRSGSHSRCCDENPELEEPVFTNLRQLQEYSLAGMICFLQQVKPQLSKADAMLCLLMSDLHVARASMMDIPFLPPPAGNSCSDAGNGGLSPALCRFHGGWGFGHGGPPSEFPVNGFLSCASELALQREIEYPKRFDLSPAMKSLLKRNVALFAAGFRANTKLLDCKSQNCSAPSSNGLGESVQDERNEEFQFAKNQDVVNLVMNKFWDLNLEDNNTREQHISLDQKDQLLVGLVNQIKDLEKQVKERKEWAHKKAMQAARKLSNDLTELKMLRMEREETIWLKKGSKESLEDGMLKNLSELENNFRKASGQVDRANAAARKLEIENAEMKAEIEASNLSASESVKICLEIAKREKKSRKKLLVCEKQKTKMQEEISELKQSISDVQKELDHVEAATKEAEAKWKLEQKAKESVVAQLEEERSLKEASELNSKRKLEALRLKIEVDFQRHKDDVQRLEQEHERLKGYVESMAGGANNGQSKHHHRILRELEESGAEQEKVSSSYDRNCIICKKDEVSIVYLPCGHQVICANCNETSYGKKGKPLCPCCRAPIEQRIRVYGAS